MDENMLIEESNNCSSGSGMTTVVISSGGKIEEDNSDIVPEETDEYGLDHLLDNSQILNHLSFASAGFPAEMQNVIKIYNYFIKFFTT